LKSYPFFHIDAFTAKAFGGNPCAVLLDTDDLTEREMLQVASEMNLPETAFARKSQKANFGLRFFTPAEEVPMAGHPTIATTLALVEAGRINSSDAKVCYELGVGIVEVEIQASKGKVERIEMTQLKPQFLRTYQPSEILGLFGLNEKDLLPGAIIQTVSTGTPQVMIPIRDLETLKKAEFHISDYVQFRKSSDFFSPHLFCLQGATPEAQTFSRHFFPPPDVIEDPFTGSVTGGIAAYLWKYVLVQKSSFIAQQGHFLGRTGQAYVTVTGEHYDIQNVKVGGEAVTCIRGEFRT